MNQLIQRLKAIAKDFDAEFEIHYGKEARGGYYNVDKRSFVICDGYSGKRHIVTAFFHELAHCLDHRDGMFKNYYAKRRTNKTKRRIALRAELHTDRLGEALCKFFFPNTRYRRSYRSKKHYEFLMAYYKDKK